MAQPEIRFNGFSDDWVEKKLDQSKIRIATGKLNANAAIINGKYPFFTTALETYMTDSYSFDDDAILIAGNGNLGFVKEYSGKFDAYQREYVLTNFEGYDKSYLVSYFKHLLGEHISHSSKGSAMPYITKDVLESFLIAASTLPEQQKIGSLFSKYDNSIALREQKLEELNALKKGLLRQMFPKDGAKVPELRFAGFADDWEEKKLGDVAQFNPKTVLPDEFEYVDLESVAGTEMISHRTESKDQAPSRAQRLAQKGDVFYQTVRPYQMNNYLYDLSYNNYVFSTGYAQMRPNIDSHFLLNSVQNKQFVQHVLDRSTGTSYPAINSNDLSKIEINVPSLLPEQQKIGQLFKHLDARISNEQAKIERLKAQKQGLLQRML